MLTAVLEVTVLQEVVIQGTASGTSTSSGSATGIAIEHGTASGTSTSTGAATGVASDHVISGTAAGSSVSAGALVGIAIEHGTGSGSSTSAGSATGHISQHGTGAGSSTSTGASQGSVQALTLGGVSASTGSATGIASIHTGGLGASVSSGYAMAVSSNGVPIQLPFTTEDELLIRQQVITLSPGGSDGTATAQSLSLLSRPGFLQYLQIEYTNQAATTNVTIKADSSSGVTLFTATNNNTEVLSYGGVPFSTGLYVSVTDANISISHAKDIVVTTWVMF